MGGIRTFVALAVISVMGFTAGTSEAALAKKAGGSGLSGTLSSNKAIRKQQLIADPNEPTNGSISIRYDPSIVSPSSLIFGPGYTGFAQIELSGDGTFLTDFNSWLADPFGLQTGYLQVTFFDPAIITRATTAAAASPHGQITPPAGYTIVDNDGPPAVDTHAFIFDYLPGVAASTVATYTVYADPGNRNSGNNADFMSVDGETIAAKDIASATVRGSLNAVPLPPAAFIGGVMFAVMGVIHSVRRSRKVA